MRSAEVIGMVGTVTVKGHSAATRMQSNGAAAGRGFNIIFLSRRPTMPNSAWNVFASRYPEQPFCILPLFLVKLTRQAMGFNSPFLLLPTHCATFHLTPLYLPLPANCEALHCRERSAGSRETRDKPEGELPFHPFCSHLFPAMQVPDVIFLH